MKSITRTLLTVAFVLAGLSAMQAQDKPLKLGHIDSQELLSVMPQAKEAEKKLAAHAKMLEEELATMQAELQKKVDDYRVKEPMMTAEIKKNKESEILDLEKRIQEFQMNAQKSYQQKTAEIQEPLLDLIRKAIDDVAKENNYNYIFDTSAGVVLYFDAGDDVLPLVKKKLGIM